MSEELNLDFLDEELDSLDGNDETVNDNNMDEPTEPQEEPKEPDLVARLEELEKAKRGLYRELKEQRKRRQSIEQRLDEIRQYLFEMAQQKGAFDETLDEEESKIPIDFDEEDNPVIPGDRVRQVAEETIAEQVIPLKQELEMTKAEIEAQKQAQAVKKLVGEVLKKDEEYPKAFKTAQKQWSWLQGRFNEWLQEQGIQPQSKEQALDLLYASPIEQEFREQFPETDLELVVDAYTAETPRVMQRKLDKLLSTLSAKNEKKEGIDSEVLKKLAGQTGFSKSTGSARKSGPKDVLDMTDEELLRLAFLE